MKRVSVPPTGLILTEAVLAISLTAALALTTAAWPALFSQSVGPVRAALDIATAADVLESVLRRHVHLAGYLGCASQLASPPAQLRPALAIYDQSHRGTAPELARRGLDKAAPDTQVLLVQYRSPLRWRAQTGSALPVLQAGDSFRLQMAEDLQAVKRGDELLVSDCLHTGILRADRVLQSGGLLLASAETALDWRASASTGDSAAPEVAATLRVAKLVRRVFYVADTGRKNDSGQAVFGLYSREHGKPATELVQGVRRWQLHLRPRRGGRFALLDIRADLQSPVALAGTISGHLSRTLEISVAAYNL